MLGRETLIGHCLTNGLVDLDQVTILVQSAASVRVGRVPGVWMELPLSKDCGKVVNLVNLGQIDSYCPVQMFLPSMNIFRNWNSLPPW